MRRAWTLALVLTLLLVAPAAAPVRAPDLRAWQAKRIAYNYAIQQQRPGYLVVGVRCSPLRCSVTGHEPGYLSPLDGPDVTVTRIERRGYQFWVRDPFIEKWSRWL